MLLTQREARIEEKMVEFLILQKKEPGEDKLAQ